MTIEGTGWALMAGYISIKKQLKKTVGCDDEELEEFERILGCDHFDKE